MNDDDTQRVFFLAGRVSNIARHIVGGDDINGFPIRPASVEHISSLIRTLREAVDEYDAEIIRRTYDEKKTDG